MLVNEININDKFINKGREKINMRLTITTVTGQGILSFWERHTQKISKVPVEFY